MVRSTLRNAVVGLTLALAPAGAQVPPLPATQVYAVIGQKRTDAARQTYLRSVAGQPVEGEGRVEAVTSRSYFDTSVPHTNPAVVLIQVAPDRKAVCGLREIPGTGDRPAWREGAAVSFRGSLADAHDWGSWATLYLADCTLDPR